MPEILVYGRGGRVATRVAVDEDDYEWLNHHRWFLCHGYATRYDPPRGSPFVFMHREILGLPKGGGIDVQGDHKNRNPLDNRRENLRVATIPQNRQNVSPRKSQSSRYRGVYWEKQRSKWRAGAKISGRTYDLGFFSNEDDAGRVASEWRAKHMPYAVEDLVQVGGIS